MSRSLVSPLAAALLATVFLAGCDGEPTDYSGARYDIVWTWIDGNFELNLPASYGSLGVAAAGNQPGARQGALQWRDGSGNFWLFGGHGYDAGNVRGRLQDLWRFEPATGLWTWVGGNSTIGGLVANSGAGVYGTPGVADVANLPGARSDAVTWVDSATGTFWLFGGQGHDRNGTFGRLGDLWRYDLAAATWTWVGGSDLVDGAGLYGTPGAADAANRPGARHSATGWRDASGALWLFGGSGFDAGGACCFLNDLWKYDGGAWTWVSGSDTKDPQATYGSQGVAAATNTPSGRHGAASWYDNDGNAWVYGGVGNTDIGARFVSAELWKYTTSGWAWIAGTQATFVSPRHDSRGQPSLTSQPGSRSRMVAWTDSAGALWLYGGDVETAGGFLTNPNDLWKFQTVAWTWVGGKAADNPAGNYIAQGSLGQPGGRAAGNGWLASDGQLWLFGGEADGFLRNDLWRYAP